MNSVYFKTHFSSYKLISVLPFQAHGDRYYLDGKIKIAKDIAITLKNMNLSPITNQPEYDYRFVVYLLTEVFGNETLLKSSAYAKQSSSHKYQNLDQVKLAFVRDVFGERVGKTGKRLSQLTSLVSKR